MKIKLFKIKNYKAFYGEHTLNFGGKNVFIYGENGSGKSSLYYALKDFFQSSVENIDFSKKIWYTFHIIKKERVVRAMIKFIRRIRERNFRIKYPCHD